MGTRRPDRAERVLRDAPDVFARAYADVVTACRALPPSRDVYQHVTVIAEQLRKLADESADLRARTVDAIRDKDTLTLAQLAEQIGVSRARAGQLVKTAKTPKKTKEDDDGADDRTP